MISKWSLDHNNLRLYIITQKLYEDLSFRSMRNWIYKDVNNSEMNQIYKDVSEDE